MLLPLMEDPLAAGDAIAALRRYSLISPPTAGSVSVHRLVQAVTAIRCPPSWPPQWQQAAAALIGAALPADPSSRTWPRSRRCCRTPRLPSADDSEQHVAGSLITSDTAVTTPAARDLSAAAAPGASRSSARNTRTP